MSQRNKNSIETPRIRVRIGLLQKTTLLRMPRDEDNDNVNDNDNNKNSSKNNVKILFKF